jgi:hypothetical protein
MDRGPRPHGYLWVKGVPDVTAATEMTTTGKLAGRERATPGQPAPGVGRAVLSTVAYVMRQLAGALATIVLVWLVVMLFRHLQVVAFVVAGLALASGAMALVVRNRSLRG